MVNKERNRLFYFLTKKMYETQRQRSKVKGWDMPTYTKQELHDWVISRDNFMELYLAWVEDDFSKEKVPSIDRTDSSLYYTMDNIKLMSWEQNRMKGNEISGEKFMPSRKIRQLDTDGNLIKVFKSAYDASKQTGVHRGNISTLCRKQGRYKTVGGFKWEFEE